MRKILLVVFVAAGLKYCAQLEPSPTPPLKQRLEILKWQLKEEIKEKQKQFSIIPPEDDHEVLDALPLRSRPFMTPVSGLKKRRKRTKKTEKPTEITTYKPELLRDTINNGTDNSDTSKENLGIRQKFKQLKTKAKNWAKHLKKYGTPLEIFYRRDSKLPMTEAEIRKRHMIHCVDLLRPILTGMKKNFIPPKIYGEQIVNRLIQLLSYGGTSQSADEVRAILLQINNLQLRFFQWDVPSIKKLFNFIMPGQKQSFKSLKAGVKKIILSGWKLNLSDTTNLIKHSRMFRPPCTGGSQGSTRSSKATRFTKPPTPKSTCSAKDKKCQANEDDIN